jgi:cystathionine beta-lyase
MMILCNPHNPIGKIWSREDMTRIAQLCQEYDVLLISDEIHCDLTRVHRSYIPAASLDAKYADKIISLYSVTKTFNLAGLHASSIYCPDDEMLQAIRKGIYRDDVGSTNAFGAIAATAAYEHGADWLALLRVYVDENLAYMQNYLQKELPSVKMVPCEATYLAWLDVSAHTDDIDAFCQHLHQNHGLYVSNGGEFKKGACFLRVNVAAPRSHIEEGLKRLVKAIQTYE